jgi:hypothetical protein
VPTATASKIDQTVALTILEQLGGTARLRTVINARNFTSTDKSVSFAFSGSQWTHVKITLRNGLYDLHWYSIRGTKLVDEHHQSCVDATNLRSNFEEQSKLRLSL